MCTCVDPLYQPFAFMSVIRASGIVTVVTSLARIAAVAVAGTNSNPFTAVSDTFPTGTSTRNSPGT